MSDGAPSVARRTLAAIAAAATVLVPMTAFATSNKITVESVSIYQTCNPYWTDIPNAVPNGTGFRNGMLPPGNSTWAAGLHYTNGDVYDTDFFDRDAPGGAWYDADHVNFDRPGDGIAYFTGHGSCPVDNDPVQPCTSSSQCTNPPPGQSLPGYCQNKSPTVKMCTYYTPQPLVTCGNYSQHGNVVTYSNPGVKWGESPTSGSWGGAGTDGGVNLAVLDISCGARPLHWVAQLGPAFAGIHFIATIMPVSGDTITLSNRGSKFAARWAANDNGSVSLAWVETLDDLPGPPAGGSACGFGGGGRGINSCGAYLVQTIDSTQAKVNQKILNQSWAGLRNDDNDGVGNAWQAWRAKCNYDCNTNPWIIP